jgi:nitroreductase
MENDLLELIKKRHSTRAAFDPDKKVVKNDLEKILESATWSPTAHNMQNFNILVIDEPLPISLIMLYNLNKDIIFPFFQKDYF